DMFGLDEASAPVQLSAVEVAAWDETERLAAEKQTLGLYLTGHPIDRYCPELRHVVSGTLRQLIERSGGQGESTVVAAGLVVELRTRNGNRGGRMAFLTLDDDSARIEVRIFPELVEQVRPLLEEDATLVVRGALGYDDFRDSHRLTAEQVWDIDGARAQFARRLVLALDADQCGNGLLEQLDAALSEHRAAGCPVCIDYTRSGARAELLLDPETWRVRPSEHLLQRLRQLLGSGERVRLEYGPRARTHELA
ncbi:MAG: OB-fold nucleic acid binding domain-containing protein, partial [Candidatus Competibacterales bacterium]|nr:OB-fold nucleic acid binding domain-containing protein [Candidatus Competibacterales bacterium]